MRQHLPRTAAAVNEPPGSCQCSMPVQGDGAGCARRDNAAPPSRHQPSSYTVLLGNLCIVLFGDESIRCWQLAARNKMVCFGVAR